MIQFAGCGLDNVYLKDGFKTMEFKGGKAYSCVDIKGLYLAIGRSLALSRHPLSGREFRFLRNALQWSQTEAGATLDKTCQAVAKWEKGVNPVARADGHVIRLAWLRRFDQGSIVRMVNGMFGDHPARSVDAYIFSRIEGVWTSVDHDWPVLDRLSAVQRVDVSGDAQLTVDSADSVYEIDAQNEYALGELMP